ncbi:hypothetical protein KAYACHO_72 [Mycobacterium phage KayaCho]|uniref:hypothetical protein n=1 Tax=Mycobacterium phage KayaCho TaxID=1340830 RepID=UPI000387F1DD|nr:hypothetical protein N846_gp72 [Mycobacterium phage KayaCho]AGT12976.1 hypothetical protein KAYACHO_72 [Mycobacterium phage KayaCho]
MTADLIIQMLSSAGVLSGVAGLLHYVNARRGGRAQASAEAYRAYRTFIETAIDGRDYQVTEEVPVAGRQPRPSVDTTTRDWCQGCGNIPIRRLMGWTESGLYRCRTCRGEPPTGLQNPPPRPPKGGGGVVVRRVEPCTCEPDPMGFDCPHHVEPERPACDGTRGNHGDPMIVCAMCCDAEPEDWGSSRTVTG